MLPTPLFPIAQAGNGGRCESTDKTKGRRGAPRGVTEPGGVPKFGHIALVSTIFWCVFSKLCNIFCVRRPPFPQHPSGEGGNAKLPTKQRGAAGRHGTLRSLAEHLNLAIPNWNPPYFCVFPPNYVIFFAPDAPLLPNAHVGRGYAKQPTKQRGAAERYGAWRNA